LWAIMENSLVPFFSPKGVAVIGASSNPNKLSYGIFKNLSQYGYQGSVYPVNPNAREILGLKCYADIRDVPDPVDLAVSVVVAGMTPDVLEACGQRGIRAVTIISGGFREVGEEGAILEEKCLRIAKEYGMRLIGPNCVGTMDLHSGLNTTFIYGVPDTGHIAFLSQSGAICGGIVDYVRGKGIGFSNFSSLGNEADVSETDVIEYLASDPNTRVITAYVEAIRNGRKFLDTVGCVSRIKPVVILKAGKTSAGARAVSSHTGSIAGSSAAYKTAFYQSGAIEVDTVSDLFDVALGLDSQPLPQGNRVVIITNAGGPAALASDSLSSNGLQLASIGEAARVNLRAHLNPSAQVSNPIDMLGGAEPADFGMALGQVLNDPDVDAVVPILVPQALIKPEAVAQTLLDGATHADKPVLSCFMGDQTVVGARNLMHKNHLPMFTFPETPGKVIGAMYQRSQWLKKNKDGMEPSWNVDHDAVQKILEVNQGKTNLGESETRPIINAYGIPVVPGVMASGADEAVDAAREFNLPVVMKIVSPDILHKSDAGGICLNVQGDEAVQSAYQQIVKNVHQFMPDARIEGVLIEPMIPKGIEVIIGMKNDPSFGPLLMFGMGGIYVELFTDIAFRIAPVTHHEAKEMILETRAGRLLSGFRGTKPTDLDGLIECIQRLGQLALDFPEIQEVEVNPLLVLPEGKSVIALDCRLIRGDV
jgi:acetate---CoA ligase (ADP-forming)